MQKRYNRNYSGIELRVRLNVVKLLAMAQAEYPVNAWCSSPPGTLPADPPGLKGLPALPNEQQFRRQHDELFSVNTLRF